MQIIPMRDLKNTVEVERRCAEENGPVFVTKNGYGRLVVMVSHIMREPCRRCTKPKPCWRGLPILKRDRQRTATRRLIK